MSHNALITTVGTEFATTTVPSVKYRSKMGLFEKLRKDPAVGEIERMSTASSHNDPFASFKFIVDIDIKGMRAGFSEVEGLPKEHGAVEHRHGDEGANVRKIPGMRKYTNLHFKRGFTNSKDLWEWHKDAKDGNTRRLSGTITLLDEARKPLLVWKFREAWPSKWEGPALNAKTSEVAIEEMEIAVEGLELTASTSNQKP